GAGRLRLVTGELGSGHARRVEAKDVAIEAERPLELGDRECDHVDAGIHVYCPGVARRLRRAISASVGSSHSNEPGPMVPARSYTVIVTPVLDTLLSTSSSPAGIVPLPKRRFPLPSTSGKIQRRSSSIRSCLSRVWSKSGLPWTWISGPSSVLSAATYSATSPLISVELFQSACSSVLEATCLRVLLRWSA